MTQKNKFAWVVELVDTPDLESCGLKPVPVRFRSRVLIIKSEHKPTTTING